MTIRLVNDRLRLWLEPDQGVAWQALQVRRGDEWLDLTPDCRPEHRPPRSDLSAASFVMIPYSNRIRHGAFSFDGRDHQLGRPDKHAIHGALRTLPWQVETENDTRALCRVDSRRLSGAAPGDGVAAVDWPWPIEATLDHSLMEARLTSEIALTNHGDTPMPAGFGWHPYFARNIAGGGPQLQIPVDTVYPMPAGDGLPSGPPDALPAELDFRSMRTLDPDQRIDGCFGGLSGRVRMRWAAAGLTMTMQASPVCTHLVLFNPDAPHFAVEPVSNANDGVNLQARGIDAGVRTLGPGETLRATMTLDIEIDED